jgi:nickel/cobalt transporter (NiCoT) family protein
MMVFDKRHTQGASMMGQLTRWCLRAVDPSTVLLFSGLVFANVAAWVWAFALFADRPVIMATALLAWVFGLRHAVDADHIAAIDNVVRKLIQAGSTPKHAGLYFALGHSTVVVMATMLLSETAIGLWGDDSAGPSIGNLIGTSISAAFLLLIALINLVTFISLWRTFHSVRRRACQWTEDLNAALPGTGVLARLLRPVFRIVTKTWHMYPLGFLFGLGFDTATAIGVMSMSVTEAVRGASLWGLLVFPALFAAGMALVDTADSVMMVNAYRWAFVDPLRKLWYNLTITGASVFIALFIGGVEALGLLGKQFGASSQAWLAVAGLNDSLSDSGFLVIGLFALAWVVSVALYRFALKRPLGEELTEATAPARQ